LTWGGAGDEAFSRPGPTGVGWRLDQHLLHPKRLRQPRRARREDQGAPAAPRQTLGARGRHDLVRGGVNDVGGITGLLKVADLGYDVTWDIVNAKLIRCSSEFVVRSTPS
jgi:hypothetical protein